MLILRKMRHCQMILNCIVGRHIYEIFIDVIEQIKLMSVRLYVRLRFVTVNVSHIQWIQFFLSFSICIYVE